MDQDKRNKKRELGYSKIWIKERDTPAYLRDLNDKGIKIDIPGNFPVKAGEHFSIIIIPEDFMDIPSFEISIEVRWIKADTPIVSLGAFIPVIKDPEQRKHFCKLIEYYKD